jgi:hypothetical protein
MKQYKLLQTDKRHRHSDRKASSWECWRQQGSSKTGYRRQATGRQAAGRQATEDTLQENRLQEDRLQEDRRQGDKEQLVGRQAEDKQTFMSTGRKASMKHPPPAPTPPSYTQYSVEVQRLFY